MQFLGRINKTFPRQIKLAQSFFSFRFDLQPFPDRVLLFEENLWFSWHNMKVVGVHFAFNHFIRISFVFVNNNLSCTGSLIKTFYEHKKNDDGNIGRTHFWWPFHNLNALISYFSYEWTRSSNKPHQCITQNTQFGFLQLVSCKICFRHFTKCHAIIEINISPSRMKTAHFHKFAIFLRLEQILFVIWQTS